MTRDPYSALSGDPCFFFVFFFKGKGPSAEAFFLVSLSALIAPLVLHYFASVMFGYLTK